MLAALAAVPVSAMTTPCPGFLISDDFSHQSGLFTGGYLKIHEYPLGVSHSEYTKTMMGAYICGLNTRMQTGQDEIEILSATVTDQYGSIRTAYENPKTE